MKKYKVIASYITYCYAEIEAENEDQAWEIAGLMDGGEFVPLREQSDWNVDSVKEVANVQED